MASVGQIKRISRIRRRASQPVREAYERGQISAKRADLLLYMPVNQQNTQLKMQLDAAREREERNRRAAAAIRDYLNGLEGQRPDLHALAGIIKAALS